MDIDLNDIPIENLVEYDPTSKDIELREFVQELIGAYLEGTTAAQEQLLDFEYDEENPYIEAYNDPESGEMGKLLFFAWQEGFADSSDSSFMVSENEG